MTPWACDDPCDAAWAIVYLVAGMWQPPHRGGLAPTGEVVRAALVELFDRHGESTLETALRLVAGQPLPHGVEPAGKLACAAVAAGIAGRRGSRPSSASSSRALARGVAS